MCACGRPLHYTNKEVEATVRGLVALHGPNTVVTIMGLGSWEVPRHYIALHGLKGLELPSLAAKFGFKDVSLNVKTLPNASNN